MDGGHKNKGLTVASFFLLPVSRKGAVQKEKYWHPSVLYHPINYFSGGGSRQRTILSVEMDAGASLPRRDSFIQTDLYSVEHKRPRLGRYRGCCGPNHHYQRTWGHTGWRGNRSTMATFFIASWRSPGKKSLPADLQPFSAFLCMNKEENGAGTLQERGKNR